MDESMEQDDSLFSLPGSSNPRALYHTPTTARSNNNNNNNNTAQGLGLHPSLVPQHLPELDESIEYPSINQWTGNASPLAPDASTSYLYEGAEDADADDVDVDGDEGGGEDVGGEGEEEGSYAESETSSAQYDPDADPEAYAKRLDELAGVLEVGEQEARALRWGPGIGRERDAPALTLADFRSLLNHHLTSTEWRYAFPASLFPLLPGRPTASAIALGTDLIAENGDIHPIRVLPQGWTERDEQLEAPESSPEPVRGGLMGGEVYEGLVAAL